MVKGREGLATLIRIDPTAATIESGSAVEWRETDHVSRAVEVRSFGEPAAPCVRRGPRARRLVLSPAASACAAASRTLLLARRRVCCAFDRDVGVCLLGDNVQDKDTAPLAIASPVID